MSDLIYCQIVENQEKININYQDGFKYHTLLTCAEGAAVVAMFNWKKDSKTEIESIQCVSAHKLNHIEKAEFITDKSGDYFLLTFGDENTKPNQVLPLNVDLVKSYDYLIKFENVMMSDGTGGGSNGSILTRPKPFA